MAASLSTRWTESVSRMRENQTKRREEDTVGDAAVLVSSAPGAQQRPCPASGSFSAFSWKPRVDVPPRVLWGAPVRFLSLATQSPNRQGTLSPSHQLRSEPGGPAPGLAARGFQN